MRLSELITTLKQTSIISSQPDLVSVLNDIDKYGENENLKAYMLGYFFKNKFDSEELPDHIKKILVSTIKENKLSDFFYLKSRPEFDQINGFVFVLTIGGPLVIIAGIIQLVNGNFSFGLGTRYLVPIIQEGGYKVLLGMGFLVGGIIRLQFDKKKNKLIKSLSSNMTSDTSLHLHP